MKNPVLAHFMAALVADRNFNKEIGNLLTVYAHGKLEYHLKDLDPESSATPNWDGWREVFDDMEWESFLDNVVRHSPHLKPLYTEEVQDALGDDPKVLFQAIEHLVPDHKAEGIFDDAARERFEEIKDGDAYSRDPYAYYGLSRRDFMASSSLKQAALRLAHTNPELRKHLVPLLRGT